MKFLRLFLSLAVIILFCFCGATGQSSVDPDHIQDSEKLSEVTTSANQQKKASSSNLRVTYQRRLPGNEYEFGNLSAGGVGAVSGILFLLLIVCILYCCCGCSLFDIFMLWCCWEICCDDGIQF
mmetsp:Transcript_14008/g.32465  ORF Transcript_14008/g.32465 Transcript_14008/m.32465 type:complete len:124 (+) Transcript_14008:164-535(+)